MTAVPVTRSVGVPASATRVCVIVVNQNRAALLSRCLDSLRCQTFSPSQILVVDNASTDGSRGVVRSKRDPRIQLLPQTVNQGFAAANNIAIRATTCPFIALLNNDAEASPSWLQHLVRAAGADQGYGMWASRILLPGGKRIDKAGHLMFPDGQNRGRATGQLNDQRFQEEEECFFPDGCAALYRTELLGEVGGFDEDFFAYADDADLGVRATWLGWRCLYVPAAIVYHDHSSTLGPYTARKLYWVERNRLWLAVKSFPLPLLLANPCFTVYRWLWNLAAAVKGRGAAGHLVGDTTYLVVVRTLTRSLADGIWGIPAMWRKRRQVFRSRRITSLQFIRKLWLYRISARDLAFQDQD